MRSTRASIEPAATPTSRRQRLLAACLAGPAVASHRAAAALWGFPGFEDAPIEVSAMRHFRRHAADVVWHESRHLGERSVTAIDGIPITRAARTIVDLGYVVDEATVVSALDDALRRALVTVASVEETLERIGPRRLGSGVVRAALKRRPADAPVPESVLESRFEQLLTEAGLPAPIRQHEIRDRHGALLARVDFAYPDARLAIEVDGAVTTPERSIGVVTSNVRTRSSPSTGESSASPLMIWRSDPPGLRESSLVRWAMTCVSEPQIPGSYTHQVS